MDPGMVLAIALLGGTALLWLGRTKAAKWVLSFACFLVFFAMLVPVGHNTVTFLENRFPNNPTL